MVSSKLNEDTVAQQYYYQSSDAAPHAPETNRLIEKFTTIMEDDAFRENNDELLLACVCTLCVQQISSLPQFEEKKAKFKT